MKLDLETARASLDAENRIVAEFMGLPPQERKNVLERVALAVLTPTAGEQHAPPVRDIAPKGGKQWEEILAYCRANKMPDGGYRNADVALALYPQDFKKKKNATISSVYTATKRRSVGDAKKDPCFVLLGAGRFRLATTAERTAAPGPKASRKNTPKGSLPSLPTQIENRINAEPDRVFVPDDFADLSPNGDLKPIWAALYRLVKPTKSGGARVAKHDRGKFRAVRTVPPTTNGFTADAPTSGVNVLAFMQRHPGAWMKAGEVLKGMGLASDRAPALRAALRRLAEGKHLQKNGGSYCLPVPSGTRRTEAMDA